MIGNTIFWFRRDLRFDDNLGLYRALSSSNCVLPVFIFDKNIIAELDKNDPRISVIFDSLSYLNKELKKLNTKILFFHGTPINVFKDLIKKYPIERVVFNHDYEPYGVERDIKIIEFLKSNKIEVKTYKDQVIFEKSDVVKGDGTPYKVYTPYSKKWIEKYEDQENSYYPSDKLLNNFKSPITFINPNLENIGFTKSKIKIPKNKLSSVLIKEYEATRNYPYMDNTSRVGVYLRFGLISIRKLVNTADKENNKTYLKELIWREFFMQILWHYPNTLVKSFKPKYDKIQWRNNKIEFKKWCNGETGYPIIDAGMRELNVTGFMHNRVRMITGSFLCKHLLIDWRWGEAYFAKKLLDYEQSSNIGNWQWVSGCGVDAAPYFRIFNPYEQIKKYDKELKYIKKWVPEFQDSKKYISPIVDHKFARERCLIEYKKALQ
jgi:deoxyribodipyrimidine photo-lyase